MANDTGLRDEHDNIVSVLYHATHGAWNDAQYISDAEKAGDDEVAGFFRDVKKQHNDLAQRAKKLLADRVA